MLCNELISLDLVDFSTIGMTWVYTHSINIENTLILIAIFFIFEIFQINNKNKNKKQLTKTEVGRGYQRII